MNRTLLVRLASALLVLFTLPALAGRLSDLPWDDAIPSLVRGGVKSAIWKESNKLTEEKNSEGKSFVRVFSAADDVTVLPDGTAETHLTIQRMLADKMVTERWRYVLKKGDPDWDIVERTKIDQADDFLFNKIEKPETATRSSKAFKFTHDLLSLEVDPGVYIMSWLGDKPRRIGISARGHVTIKPVDDYEGMFFERRFGKRGLDSDVTEVVFDFHVANGTFVDLVGYQPSAPASSSGDSGLKDLYERAARLTKGKEWTPYVYSPPPRDEFKDDFSIGLKTVDNGWVWYNYSKTEVKEISIYRERGGLSLSSDTNTGYEQVSFYYAPESRKLPPVERERRRGFRLLDATRFDAQFDIDSEKFVGYVAAQITTLRDTKTLEFALSGNPSIRRVTWNGKDLMFVPVPSLFSRVYGFEETNNETRIYLPQEVKAGTRLDLVVTFDSPKIVRMYSSGFWYVDRGGFLPFMGGLEEASYMRFVMRTKKDYEHLSIGSKISEEIAGDYRYTEWSAESGINFPTLIIGKYFPVVTQDGKGFKVSGYMTTQKIPLPEEFAREAMDIPDPNRGNMVPQVEQATSSTNFYASWLNTPYPFKDLKLIGTPAQFLSAQSPTSMVYIADQIFWPQQAIATVLPKYMGIKSIDATWTQAVTAHEVAHQWFGGQVSNVSFYHSWWVESLTEFASYVWRKAAGDKVGAKNAITYWRTNGMAFDWQRALIDDPLRREPNIRMGLSYYTKGPLLFLMLSEYYSEERLLQYFRNILTKHKGDLISTYDLQVVAEQTFGEKMDWFFDQYIRNVGVPQVSYKFEAPRPAEDGKGWIVTGKLRQDILLKGEPMPGRVFKHLLVPITVETEKGVEKQKVFLDTQEQEVRVRFESKPKGSLKINDNEYCYLTTKEL